MKNKPDDRSDNVGKIQKTIESTLHNVELANEMIAETSDEKTKHDLKEKNERRKDAVRGMRNELKDETEFAKSQTK